MDGVARVGTSPAPGRTSAAGIACVTVSVEGASAGSAHGPNATSAANENTPISIIPAFSLSESDSLGGGKTSGGPDILRSSPLTRACSSCVRWSTECVLE